MNKAALREALAYSPGPGKFEGEPPSTVYYYYCGMDGDGQDIAGCDCNIQDESTEINYSQTLYKVDLKERKAFGLADDSVAFEVYEDSQGFVFGNQLTQSDLDAVGITLH